MSGVRAALVSLLLGSGAADAEAQWYEVVAVQGNMVQGQIEPYVAPDCECVVVTEFLGTLKGDAIEGRYDTRRPGVRQEGRWLVRRTSKAP